MKRRHLVYAGGLLGTAIVFMTTLTGGLDAPRTVNVELSDEADDDDGNGFEPSSLPYEQAVSPLVSRYCLECHGRDRAGGGIILEGLGAEPSNRDLLLWRKAAQAMRSGIMPPSDRPQPSAENRNAFSSWLAGAEFRANCTGSAKPGRIPLRRLNRAEYNNTIRDLTGLDIRPADDFPADDVGYGFDNIGDVLAISPLLTERYVEAAEKIVDRLFAAPDARNRLMNPPPYDSLPYGLRGLLPVRDEDRKTLHISQTPADPAQQEHNRAGNIIRAFADRAYRRPIRYDELNRLARFVEASLKEGAGIEPGLKLALQAVLASPHFLFQVEGWTAPANIGVTQANRDFELAGRLSYFLWSSMPDDTLYQLAAFGKLHEPPTLRAQARRMLRDPRRRLL